MPVQTFVKIVLKPTVEYENKKSKVEHLKKAEKKETNKNNKWLTWIKKQAHAERERKIQELRRKDREKWIKNKSKKKETKKKKKKK